MSDISFFIYTKCVCRYAQNANRLLVYSFTIEYSKKDERLFYEFEQLCQCSIEDKKKKEHTRDLMYLAFPLRLVFVRALVYLRYITM